MGHEQDAGQVVLQPPAMPADDRCCHVGHSLTSRHEMAHVDFVVRCTYAMREGITSQGSG